MIDNSTIPPTCHHIPSTLPNTTYCGITSTWESRFSTVSIIIMLVVPSIIAIVVWLFVMVKLSRKLYKKHVETTKEEEWEKEEAMELAGEKSRRKSINPGCDCFSSHCPFCSCSCLCSCSPCSDCISSIYKCVKRNIPFVYFVIFPIVTMTWDTVDVGIDLYCFYQLEKGLLFFDHFIVRNHHVINGIYAFAVLGCVKLIVCSVLLYDIPDVDVRGELKVAKLFNYITVFLLEDCAELFLQYFYIEKYFTGQPTLVLFVRDIILFLIAFYTVIDNVMFARSEDKGGKGCSFDRFMWLLFIVTSVTIGVTTLLRVVGAGYQYVTSELHSNCLDVVDGALIQSPFKQGCLREIDYVIISIHFIPIIGIVIFVIWQGVS